MTQQQTLDRDRTVVIIMDYQNDIVKNVSKEVIQRASQVLEGARQVGIPVIYVTHRGGRFETPSSGTEIHSGVAPSPGDRIIAKTRTSPFSTTGLDVLLREMGKDTLVLMGVSTSGCVLSTVRWAADINYNLVVIGDACGDPDPEVHRVLIEKIYPRQGTVMAAEEFLQAAGVS